MKKTLLNILKKNDSENLEKVYLMFKNFWQEGVSKKNNLVKWFVESSKRRQSLTLHLIRNKSL